MRYYSALSWRIKITRLRAVKFLCRWFESKEALSEDEALEQAEKMREKIDKGEAGNYDEAEKLVERSLAKIKDFLISDLKRGRFNGALSLKEAFNVSEEIIQSAEVQAAAKEGIIFGLKSIMIDEVGIISLKEAFNVSEEIIQSAEVQAAAKSKIILCIRNRYIDTAISLKEAFNVSEEIMQSAEVQAAAKEAMISSLKDDDVDSVV